MKIEVTKIEHAYVVETTTVVFTVPDGTDIDDWYEDREVDGSIEDAMTEAESQSRDTKGNFVGSKQVERSWDWSDSTTDYAELSKENDQ